MGQRKAAKGSAVETDLVLEVFPAQTQGMAQGVVHAQLATQVRFLINCLYIFIVLI